MNTTNTNQEPNTPPVDETTQNNMPEPETAEPMPEPKKESGPVQMLNKISSGITAFFKNNNSYMVPASIVLAGLLISGAIVFGDSIGGKGQAINDKVPAQANIGQAGNPSDNVKKVTGDDHIRGAANAPVKIVEFSDLQCPFCQRFHTTMQQVLGEFDGQVAWVYRHFPLESIHPRALPQAAASECIAELGGNDKFWAFVDAVFQTNLANSDAQLSQMAVNLGINRNQFESCYQSGRYDSFIKAQTQDAQNSGGRGTPYSVVIAPNGKTFVINGAQTYATVKATIEQALQSK
ncbi:MAG: thioredoxin domain-containing protein [bacterium]|nr:thioredoxin domain-containing protein [bacterium]